MIPAPRPPFASRADRDLARKLDLYRIRGRAARAARQARQVPPLPRSTPPEHAELIAAAWLAGWDRRR